VPERDDLFELFLDFFPPGHCLTPSVLKRLLYGFPAGPWYWCVPSTPGAVYADPTYFLDLKGGPTPIRRFSLRNDE